MAMGVGLFFNISLPINFNSPYQSKSISEFWQRWHMTLTGFFTTYLYIPLGGSRKGKIRTYWNTFFVFLVSGLWHGANWTFLFWGALHGAFMVLEKIGKDLGLGLKNLPSAIVKAKEILQWVITFSIVNIAWVFFRAESMEQASVFFRRLFSGGWQLSDKITEYVLDIIELRILLRLGIRGVVETHIGVIIPLLLAGLVLICLFSKNTNEKTKTFNHSLGKGILTLVLLTWSIISLSNITEFLYFEF